LIISFIFYGIFPNHCKALNSLLCADVPLRNYSLTHSQEAQLPQRKRASIITHIVRCKRHFDMLNRLGMDHKCDRQIDRWMDGRTGSR